jgi:hypothetical protein
LDSARQSVPEQKYRRHSSPVCALPPNNSVHESVFAEFGGSQGKVAAEHREDATPAAQLAETQVSFYTEGFWQEPLSWSSFIRRNQPGGEEKCVVIPRLEFWLLSFPSFS